MKRTAMKRKRKPKPRTYETVEQEIAARLEWRAAAQAQKCCQHPDCETPSGPWEAHHVVYEQHVVKRGFPRYDARNCLRLCLLCHTRHHARIAPVPIAVLQAHHLEYAEEVLGESYLDYLNRKYLDECLT